MTTRWSSAFQSYSRPWLLGGQSTGRATNTAVHATPADRLRSHTASAIGTAHTQSRYKNAFYAPIISDWRNYESWQEAGSPTAIERANRIWKERLATYTKPAIDPAIEEEIDAFVARRKSEGGAPTDF